MVMPLDVHALVEDTANARIQLFKAHCEQSGTPTFALLVLASQLMHQANIVLTAVYCGDQEMARQHMQKQFGGDD